MKIRIKFSKQGSMKFVGHLDIMRYFQKAMRRGNVDIRYSEGFSPHQIMSFAAPLGVGITSSGEYLDIEVADSLEPAGLDAGGGLHGPGEGGAATSTLENQAGGSGLSESMSSARQRDVHRNLHEPGDGRTATQENQAGESGIPESTSPARQRDVHRNLHEPGGGRTATQENQAGEPCLPESAPPARQRDFPREDTMENGETAKNACAGKNVLSSQAMADRLNQVMAEEIRVLSCKRLPDSSKNAMSIVCAADYTLEFRKGYEPEDREEFFRRLAIFYGRERIVITKKTKKGQKEMDLKPLIYRLERQGEGIFMQVSTGSTDNIKPELVMEAFYQEQQWEYPKFAFRIQREEVYGRDASGNRIPLEEFGEDIE